METAIGIYIVGFIVRLVWVGMTECDYVLGKWEESLWQGLFALLWPLYAILFAPAAIIIATRSITAKLQDRNKG